MIILYINCKLFPFVSWIIARLKLYETRNRNTLKALIGKRVYIAETGRHKKPIIRCVATIESMTIVDTLTEYNKLRKYTKVEKGSIYDFIPGKKKYLYRLTDVQEISAFPVPENIIRHGRTWSEVISDTESGKFQQWIADDYHCSSIWGQKQTEEEMLTELVETLSWKDPEEYSPAPYLYKECAAYWNQLCDMYPY